MKISTLGEFGLIERFRRAIRTDKSVIQGSGDDCAVIKLDKKRDLLFTCDMTVEGVDFQHKENPYLVGRKAIAVSISDIAACGGWPHWCLVSLAMPKNTALAFVDRLFKGMLDLAKKYQVNIVGGDISRAEKLILDVSMLGVVEKECLVLRSGAQKGDIIFVSGKLGGSILGRHLKFRPCLKEARFLVKNFKINAMLDISDGLIQDLGQILKASKVGAALYGQAIPLSNQARNLEDALYMGEDFQLLFTLSRTQAKKLSAKKITVFHPIGEIVDIKYGCKLIDRQGKAKKIKPLGFQHF